MNIATDLPTQVMTWDAFLSLDGDEQRLAVLATMRQVVTDAGDGYTYPYVACRYVNPTTVEPRPGCIVGHVLHRLGLDLATLAEWDRYGGTTIDGASASHQIKAPALGALVAAQRAQDGVSDADRLPWSRCLEYATTAGPWPS
jgi:hypothetical protein